MRKPPRSRGGGTTNPNRLSPVVTLTEIGMDVPLEIRFHDLNSSEAAEKRIRERVAKLERLDPRLVACRVGVEKPHRKHRNGNASPVNTALSEHGHTLAGSKTRPQLPAVHTRPQPKHVIT